LARVEGSGPETIKLPSSANPTRRPGLKSKSFWSELKARFQAMGLKTPPFVVPLLRYLLIVVVLIVIRHDLVLR
jgi:hypothetical protein